MSKKDFWKAMRQILGLILYDVPAMNIKVDKPV